MPDLDMRGEDGGERLPTEADFLRETIKVVEWQRDNARQERNEERDRAATAEAEVVRLKAERDEEHKRAELGWQAWITACEVAEAANLQLLKDEATAANLRDRVAVLEDALRAIAVEGANGVYVWPGPDCRGVIISMPGAFEAVRTALIGGDHARD